MAGAPLIIDCDPGVDDAIAILLALGSPELDLRAVTTVAGNRSLDSVTHNALGLLALAGRGDVPVFRGAGRGLLPRNVRFSFAHGDDGLGGYEVPPFAASAGEAHAADAIADIVMAEPPGTVTLAAIGPLTNVALAFAKAPALAGRLKRLAIMGGAVGVPGNITPVAEFNFMHDAVAAEIVLSSGAAIDLFGLNLTRRVVVTDELLAALEAGGGHVALAAAAMLRAYAQRDLAIHDPCVIADLLVPGLFGRTARRIAVDYRPGPTDAQSIVDMDPASMRPLVNLVDEVDAPAVLSLLAERITRLG